MAHKVRTDRLMLDKDFSVDLDPRLFTSESTEVGVAGPVLLVSRFIVARWESSVTTVDLESSEDWDPL